MQMTKIATLRAIAKVIEKHGGNYSFAANAHYQESLKKFYGIRIGMRCLIYHMTTLRKEGLIKSIRRYQHDLDGKISRRTSAVCVTVKGYLKLAKLGWSWAAKMANTLGKKFIPKWKSIIGGTLQKAEELTDEQLQKVNEQNRLNYKYPPLNEKVESELFKISVEAAKKAGVTLYDYLLKKPQPQSPLHHGVQVVPDKP